MKPNNSNRSSPSKFHRYLLFSKFLSVLLLTILLIFPYQKGHCAQVTLAWDPDSVSDLAGYKIYYGTASGNYQGNVDVGNVTTYTLNNLTIGTTYYAAATAYIISGLESSFSNEVMYTVPSCTYVISPSSASFAASGGTGSVSITTPSYCNWMTSSGISWIGINTGSGMGSGSMTYSISPNTGTASRVGSLTIAGNVFTVTENGVAMNTITASAGAGGSISPSGQVSVQQGVGQAFTVTPNTGYTIADVKVDGVSKGPITSYAFSNVQANHTISATFTSITYTYTLSITKNGTGGGSVSTNPSGTVFPAGTAVTLTAAADINSVFAGWSGGCTGTASTCQVTVNSNLGVTAAFNAKVTLVITATAGKKGSISPSGQVSVQPGVGQRFIISPDARHRILSVQVDGVSQGPVASYTFSNVTANHKIAVSFR